MRKIIILTLLFLVTCFAYSQNKHPHKSYVYFPENVDKPLTVKEKQQIQTVFGSFAETIFNNKTLLKNYKHFLRNRVKLYKIDLNKYSKSPNFYSITELSSVPLYDTYNKSLTTDYTINEQTFNPLKYQLTFFPKETITYRQGDYLIKIKPQQKNGEIK